MKRYMKFEEVIKTSKAAIMQRHCLYFYYESQTPGNKEWREIQFKSYLKKLRIDFRTLLKKIDKKQLEVLTKTFDDPGDPRKRVVDTPT
jgi:hypothetical protein